MTHKRRCISPDSRQQSIAIAPLNSGDKLCVRVIDSARIASSMIASFVRRCLVVVAVTVATDTASASSAYDGSWALTIYTRRGACDPTYYFQVEIRNGIIFHPNLLRLRGRVTAKGAVRVSVAVPGKFAAGSGRLTRTSGTGRWSGHSENARCSGTWAARRF